MGGPLSGRRIVVTRTREQGSVLAAELRARDAEVLEIPTIRVEPPNSFAPLDAALAKLANYDVLLVTSANTVRVLTTRKPPPWGVQPYTVAIGPATAEALRTAGLRVDLQPEPAVAESIVGALAPAAAGRRMLLVRAAIARELLPEALRSAGAAVDVVDAYRTVLAEESRPLLEMAFAKPVDAVSFTSSSTVENFFALIGEERARNLLARGAACSIGPITSKTLRSFRVEPAIEAAIHDVGGLLAAILTRLCAPPGA